MPNPVYNIPGYGAYVARREQQAQQQLGDIQKAGALLAIKQKMEAQKAAQQQNSEIQSAGGDLPKIQQILLNRGDFENAERVRRLMESQTKKVAGPLAVPPGTAVLERNADGTLKMGDDGKPVVSYKAEFKPPSEPSLSDLGKMLREMNDLAPGDPNRAVYQRALEAKNKDKLDDPLSAAETGHWQGPDGKPPPPGTTRRDLINRGYKFVSTAEANKAAEAKGAYATIDRLDELTAKLWGDKDVSNGAAWRITQKGKWTQERLTQSNTELAEFEAFAKGTLAPLIRAVGEKGNLATEDIERALLLIPSTGQGTSLPDTPAVARGKMRQLREWFDRAQGKTEAKSPSVDDLLKKYGGS